LVLRRAAGCPGFVDTTEVLRLQGDKEGVDGI
jgi:hypothetical protein